MPDHLPIARPAPLDRIIKGQTYVYMADKPDGRAGCHYKVLALDILHAISRQWLVLVKALDGPDAGLVFVTTPANFSHRYLVAE